MTVIKYYSPRWIVFIPLLLFSNGFILMSLLLIYQFIMTNVAGLVVLGLVFFSVGTYLLTCLWRVIRPKNVKIILFEDCLIVKKPLFNKVIIRRQDIIKTRIKHSDYIKNIYDVPKFAQNSYTLITNTHLDFLGVSRGLTFEIHAEKNKIVISRIDPKYLNSLEKLQQTIQECIVVDL